MSLFGGDGQHNMGYLCTGKQCAAGNADKVAMRFIVPSLERHDYTFKDLDVLSNRFANVLAKLGFAKGDSFFTFLPKAPAQFIAFLGALKHEVVVGTLFSNFGEEAILDRLGDAGAAGVITKRSFVKKIAAVRSKMPRLRYILVVDIDDHLAEDILSYDRLMKEASTDYHVSVTSPETPAILHYTSGSTGKPKGVVHLHRALSSHAATASSVLGLRGDDIYWCTADQGWVTGTSYGILGPWSLGVTQIQFSGSYNADSWFSILEEEEVTVWYTAPTALRMLMREEPVFYEKFVLKSLRHIFSVGEPLNPEVIAWTRRTFGHDIFDTWFQTETGAIMIANRPGLEVRPGAMGKPVDGIEAAILTDEGEPVPDTEPGNLCVKTGWPSMFAAYLNNPGAYASKFRNGYYFSGDTAYRDADGYFWFLGRTDDVINTAGHLISPFEIESTLLEIEEVAEAGVVGVPDEILFEKVVAFVTLHRKYTYSQELELKIRLYVTHKLSSVATPHDVVFLPEIPKNKSGKIMRRVLKARYLGTDEGDISTLEV
ncbi:MAG TPA: AMP-binding protein [Geobacteraceae bacterium]|nr:AMP-binding protein [Geobacteraceae bacterium]